MRPGQRWRDCDCLLRVVARFWPLGLAVAAEISNQSERFGTLCVSQSVISVAPTRLIEVADSFAIIFKIASLAMIVTQQISVMRFRVFRRRLGGLSLIRTKQSYFQRRSHSRSDFLLDSEDVLQFTIERSRPKLDPVCGID